MYQPQGNGVKQEPQTIEGSDFKVMDTDPLKPRIESREDGIYWVSPRADSQSGEIINNESWLCSPLSVIGLAETIKTSISFFAGCRLVLKRRQPLPFHWLILVNVKDGAHLKLVG